MSRKTEIDTLATEAEAKGIPLTAERVVDAAKNAESFPELHAFLWEVAESELAAEARLSRAHKLLISIRIVTEDGVDTRFMVHTGREAGYRPLTSVVTQFDLASVKLKQFANDVSRARMRLREFRSLIDPAVADQIEANLKAAEEIASKPLRQPDVRESA
jgi:hypothetical protein